MHDDKTDLDKAISDRKADLLKKSAGYIGECRQAVPFGEEFYVTSAGRRYISCTHKPPHKRLAD